MSSDEVLMREFQQGSRPACEELYARYSGPLYGFFRRRLESPQRAEDLAQETFLAVIRGARRYEPRALVRTYLCGIALKMLASERRKQRGSVDSPDPAPEPSAPSTQESGLWVREALAKLDSADREILMLREYELLSYGFRNAAIDGYRNVFNFVIGVATFLISDGPMLVVWTLILLLPGRWAWRRYRNYRETPSLVTTFKQPTFATRKATDC